MAPINTYTYEEGTVGTTPTVGANGVTAMTGTPIYSSDAAHGALGLLSEGAESVRYDVAYSGSLYSKLLVSQTSATARPIFILRETGGQLASIRFHFDGFIDIAGLNGGRKTASTVPWIIGEQVRFDWQMSYNATNLTMTITLRIFKGSNAEGTVPNETITATDFAAAAPPTSINIGNTVAAWNVVNDTYRTYAASEWAEPYNPTPPPPTVGTVLHLATGASTDTGFVVTSKLQGATSVRLAVSSSSNMASPVYSTSQVPDSTGYVRNQITGLVSNTSYFYQIEDTPSGGSPTLIGTVGKSKTLPTPNTPANFTVAAISCTLKGASDGVAHSSVVAYNPTFAVHLGDFYYTSSTSTLSSTYEALYADMIETYPSHAELTRDIPTFYASSDHEAGPDNGDSNNAWTTAQKEAYHQVLPTPSTQNRYSSWIVGRVRFILIDTRTSARSPGLNVDSSSKTMLGSVQKQWLKDRLSDTGELKVILSDPGWMGAASTTNGEDKWWSYAVERQEIIDYISANNVRVALVHGDSHAIAVASKTKNTWGNFPVICASPLAQVGGGRNLTTFDSFYNNASGAARQYMRLSFADDGTTITLTASGWDATNNIQRVSMTESWSTPLAPTVKVWNGTIEQSASITVWNGTAEAATSPVEIMV